MLQPPPGSIQVSLASRRRGGPRPWMALLLAIGTMVVLSLPLARAARAPDPAAPTSYDLAWAAPFNRPDHYPLERRPDPALYRPHSDWFGRLILPGADEMDTLAGDWVWLELEQAPAGQRDLIGRRLRLGWQDDPLLRALVGKVSTPVRLGAEARLAAGQGNVVPRRLAGRGAVGPLQSLAGAHPHDDISVRLEQVEIARRNGEPELRIGKSPLQSTGRWVALVRLLSSDPSDPERFRVQHYVRRDDGFSGPIETVRLPRQPPDRNGRRLFDPAGLLATRVGEDGWYLYGAPDADGTFTVQALEPRRLTSPEPDRLLRGTAAGLNHIARINWSARETRRGHFSRVGVVPDGDHEPWKTDDTALLIHYFGGIGGPDGEAISGFTVTGHFAFGEARIVPDPFTGAPRFDLLVPPDLRQQSERDRRRQPGLECLHGQPAAGLAGHPADLGRSGAHGPPTAEGTGDPGGGADGPLPQRRRWRGFPGQPGHLLRSGLQPVPLDRHRPAAAPSARTGGRRPARAGLPRQGPR